MNSTELRIRSYSPNFDKCNCFLISNFITWLDKKKSSSNAHIIEVVKDNFAQFDESYFSDGIKNCKLAETSV